MEAEIDKKPMLHQCEMTDLTETFEEPAIATVEVSWIDLTLKFDDI